MFCSFRCFFLLLLFLSSCSLIEPKNQYVDGLKHGPWVEYLNENFTREVPKDSAKYYREVEFRYGIPTGLARDYYINGQIQGEEFLISGPYTETGPRPMDKAKGLMLFFDSATSKIMSIDYRDDNNQTDFTKLFSKGYTQAFKDQRFDKEYFRKENRPEYELYLKYETDSTKFLKRLKEAKVQAVELGFDKNESLMSFALWLGLFNKYGIDWNDEEPAAEESYEAPSQYEEPSSENYTYEQQAPQPRKCYSCNGTGKCKSCSQIFKKPYYKGDGSYEWRNETRMGLVMCNDCFGRGHKQKHRDFGGWEPAGDCYVSGCQDGWVNCRECNSNGNGQYLGQCQRCRGTGES